MKKILNYFLQGLIFIVPIGVSVALVIYLYKNIGQLGPFDNDLLNIIFLFFATTLIGVLSSRIIASPFNALFSKILDKAPLLKTIYSSVKDLMNTLFGNKKGFDQAVLVKIYDNSTIERFGFITNDDLTKLNINNGKVLVYIPHSLTFSGNVFLVDKKNLTPIDTPSRDVMKMIVSGGVSEVEN
tara:strand:- start:366 stop:917 length:552 start_codon:yes stop_codon:yes gene_type:complete